LQSFEPGQTLLLSGTIYTGRDAAHKRMIDMLDRGEELPVDLKGRAIYYVGPVDAVGDEVIGPAGPTTSTRMDKFTDRILNDTGLKMMIGKAERGDIAIEAIAKHKAVYLIAVGGAAYLVSKAIKSAKPIAFQDLGMEAIYELEVEDMPVNVGVDTNGNSIHKIGPALGENRRLFFVKRMIPTGPLWGFFCAVHAVIVTHHDPIWLLNKSGHMLARSPWGVCSMRHRHHGSVQGGLGCKNAAPQPLHRPIHCTILCRARLTAGQCADPVRPWHRHPLTTQVGVAPQRLAKAFYALPIFDGQDPRCDWFCDPRLGTGIAKT
jgi:tartrate/fumarate subfamily iron-sulfur-dependent hydro-lyase beta chain